MIFLLVEAAVCCRFYYWSEAEVVQTKIIVQSVYTSVIEQSLLQWNAMLQRMMQLSFTIVMWQSSDFNWYANFLAAEVTA